MSVRLHVALNPRSLLVTLYGDYVEPLGESGARVGALLRIAEALGVTSTVPRTALDDETGGVAGGSTLGRDGASTGYRREAQP